MKLLKAYIKRVNDNAYPWVVVSDYGPGKYVFRESNSYHEARQTLRGVLGSVFLADFPERDIRNIMNTWQAYYQDLIRKLGLP